ncbi:MAG: ATP-binding protein [Treponema sp.]|nr:ATP-binding protein [Treponema sp.]
MSKIESGKFVLIHDPFVLLDALEEVSEIIKVRCEEKQQQFISTYEKIPNVSVLGDKLRLKQVLINLLGNAVKFTPERGKIELLCSNAEAGCRELFITFSIIDSGIGMTPEQINKLFNPFEQTDNSIAIRFGGTGLGLVISQDLVNQMGGKIVVKSNPGEGSVFSFTIGLEVTEFIKKDIIVPDDYIPDLKGKRLLLAEDIEINRVIIAELLSETNVTIDEAEDGRKAVDKFSSAIPGYYDFIFMDIQMPNMNGYDAARLIRETEKERCKGNSPFMPVPIYAMTANAYREDIEKAIDAGMNGHVAKPVDVKILMKVLGENFPA